MDKTGVGKRIREIRLTSDNLVDHTMEEFAEKIGSNKSNVSRWERGINIPNESTLRKIADLGQTTVDYLKYGSPSERAINVANRRIKERVKKDKVLQQMYNSNPDNLTKTAINAVLSKLNYYTERYSDEPFDLFNLMFDDYFSDVTDVVIDTELKMPSRNDKEVLDNVFEILVQAFGETTNIIETIKHSGFQGEITDETIEYLYKVSDELKSLIDQTLDRENN